MLGAAFAEEYEQVGGENRFESLGEDTEDLWDVWTSNLVHCTMSGFVDHKDGRHLPGSLRLQAVQRAVQEAVAAA